jgi:signal transduction histidine kinase
MSRHTYTQEQLRLAVAIGRLAGMEIENIHLLESRVQTERLAAAGETVAYLSHYIRNILQGMQGGADVIEHGLKADSLDAARSGWTLIRHNLDRILMLTMNMLTFGKEREPRIEMVRLHRVIADVVALAQSRADEKAVMILVDLEDMPPVPVDPDGIHQVINNILLNAIQAAPKQTGHVSVSVRLEPDDGEVVVSIGDNGPGIEPEMREKIFDPFDSSKGHGGTGLGLAAARKIMSELGGRIELQSTVGEGTVFRVHLPLERRDLPDSDDTHGPDGA